MKQRRSSLLPIRARAFSCSPLSMMRMIMRARFSGLSFPPARFAAISSSETFTSCRMKASEVSLSLSWNVTGPKALRNAALDMSCRWNSLMPSCRSFSSWGSIRVTSIFSRTSLKPLRQA